MSKREILAIAIKVFSLWFCCQLFVQASTFSPWLMTLSTWKNSQIPVWVYVVFPTCFLLAGAIIALLLSRISNSVLSSLSSEQDVSINQKFLLQVVGLFFIVSGLTYLPSSASALISAKEVQFSYYLRPFGYIVQLAIGLWLLVHSSWWVLLLNKLRGRV